MKINKIFFYLLTFIPLLTLADDLAKRNAGTVFGHGAMSCKEYRISLTSNTKKVQWMKASYGKIWVQGILTAIDQELILNNNKQFYITDPLRKNRITDFTSNLFENHKIKSDMDDDINTYCKQNPQHQIAATVMYHFEKWYPAHLIDRADGEEAILELPHLSSGDNSCRDYNKAQKNTKKFIMDEKSGEVVDLDWASNSWLQGFVSGTSFLIGESGKGHPPLQPMHSIQELKKFCQSNPDKKIFDFANDYVYQYLYSKSK